MASHRRYITALQKIIITRFTHDNSASVNLGANNQYRYIITPGGTSAKGASPVDWSDYKAVAAYFGIPD
ncbi:MAG: hypothetical protein EOO09_19380 [Chitinophagaceae bacterium]|nr:MAG: hypothetical protein EOO09_19380 [Chitinophagaceae bacterium]